MAKETAAGVTPEPEVVTTEEAVIEEPKETQMDEAGYKALIAKFREGEKQAKKDAKRLADLELQAQTRADAEKTELQKAQDRAAQLEADLKNEKLRTMRRDVAGARLPAILVERIQGETLEDMEADVLKILESMPHAVAPKLEPTNPGQPQTGEADADRRKRLLG